MTVAASRPHILARLFVATALAAVLGTICTGVARAAGTTHTVVIEAMAYKPANLTVRKGDTIVWINKDLFPHTATAHDKSFDSREIGTGKSWKLIAIKGGKVGYLCTLHPTMEASLTVE